MTKNMRSTMPTLTVHYKHWCNANHHHKKKSKDLNETILVSSTRLFPCTGSEDRAGTHSCCRSGHNMALYFRGTIECVLPVRSASHRMMHAPLGPRRIIAGGWRGSQGIGEYGRASNCDDEDMWTNGSFWWWTFAAGLSLPSTCKTRI